MLVCTSTFNVYCHTFPVFKPIRVTADNTALSLVCYGVVKSSAIILFLIADAELRHRAFIESGRERQVAFFKRTNRIPITFS